MTYCQICEKDRKAVGSCCVSCFQKEVEKAQEEARRETAQEIFAELEKEKLLGIEWKFHDAQAYKELREKYLKEQKKVD